MLPQILNVQKKRHKNGFTAILTMVCVNFRFIFLNLRSTIFAIILKLDASTSTDSDGSETVVRPPPAKKRRMPRILDGTYYEIVSIDEDNVEAKCMGCDKIRKGNLKSTGNFIGHYRNAHSESIQALENYLNRSLNFEPNRSKPVGVSAPPTSKEDV